MVGQQVSVAAATSINKKLVDALEGQLTATAVLDASEELFARCRAVTAESKLHSVPGDRGSKPVRSFLESLPELSDEDAVAVITNIKGFGEWSAHMYLMFFLGETRYLACWRSRCQGGV